TGHLGSFETDLQVPNIRNSPQRMSSVVLSSQRVPATGKKSGPHPLVQDQTELVPNIPHVFTPDQHLYLQYEIYDAARGRNSPPAANANTAANGRQAATPNAAPQKSPRDAVRVLTSIEFLQGNVKVYESKSIVANEVTVPDRKAV